MEKTHHGNKKFYNKPIISVAMPSCNHENYIDDAINSAVSQRIENLEVIVVDDFSKNRSRIKAIFHSKMRYNTDSKCNIKIAKGE
ncbi:MAG: glycosyltransferase family A protein [Candidatus Bathyarchaeia archaeon]